MRLRDLLQYNSITIQCHDNPDADTIGAGYGLYCYFRAMRLPVRMIYSGKNPISKNSLIQMTKELEIPLEYISPAHAEGMLLQGLLITVDCQYRAGNVTPFVCDHVAMIDHHPLENRDVTDFRVQPELGSCATLVWEMLQEESFPMEQNHRLGTALYYGLYTDTNQFSELFGPRDLLMREHLDIDQRILKRLRNTNLSLEELSVAGVALQNYFYDPESRFAIVRTPPCDPNVLGLISDFLMQVGEIDLCVVYNEMDDGYKLSVRSCIRETSANELATYITREIGTGGGHYERAGGFISHRLFAGQFGKTGVDQYLRICLKEYCGSFQIIRASDYEAPIESMKRYRRMDRTLCYVRLRDFLAEGRHYTLSTKEGSDDFELEGNDYLLLEPSGAARRMPEDIFQFCMEPARVPVPEDYLENRMEPTLQSWGDGQVFRLMDYVHPCRPRSHFQVYAQKLTRNVKVFPIWDEDRYMAGGPGDFLVVSAYDLHNVFVEKNEEFQKYFLEDYSS